MIRQLYGIHDVAVTFVMGSEKVNGNQHGGKDVCTCSKCEDILMTILKLCLQNSKDRYKSRYTWKCCGSHKRGNIG